MNSTTQALNMPVPILCAVGMFCSGCICAHKFRNDCVKDGKKVNLAVCLCSASEPRPPPPQPPAEEIAAALRRRSAEGENTAALLPRSTGEENLRKTADS